MFLHLFPKSEMKVFLDTNVLAFGDYFKWYLRRFTESPEKHAARRF